MHFFQSRLALTMVGNRIFFLILCKCDKLIHKLLFIGVDDLVRVIMKASFCNCVVSDVIFATVNFSSENVPLNYIENSLFLKKTTKNSYNLFKNNFGIIQVQIGTPFSLKVSNAYRPTVCVQIFDKHLPLWNGFQEIIASSHITSHSQTISRTDVITKDVVTRLNFGMIMRQIIVLCFISNRSLCIIFISSTEFSRSQILMSTHLVSFIMLYKFRDGVKFVDLVKTVDALRNELTLRKKCLLGFAGTTENVVKHAVSERKF